MRSRGFTLMETMITIFVLGLLLFVGVPLTQAWSNSGYQREAAGLLKQGISRTKAMALRNPEGAQGTAPAAVLCRSGQTLKLFSITTGQTIDCSLTTNILWSSSIPKTAGIQASGVDVTCIAFNNEGTPLNVNSCTTTTIQITAGSENAVNVPII